MTSATSSQTRQTGGFQADSSTRPLKIVVSGGFASGKTTFVESTSEITPLQTEAPMTSVAAGIDDAGQVTTKTHTTVAMDFGRITLENVMLFLFGTPGQDRFWFMWDELSKGTIGAVVMVDTRRLDDCFAALDYFESRSLPYVVALNRFDGVLHHEVDAVREALTIDPETPVVTVDARDPSSTQQVLLDLVGHAINRKRKSLASEVQQPVPEPLPQRPTATSRV